MMFLLCQLALGIMPAAAQEYKIIREGPYWVRVDVGVLPPPAGARLRVDSPGTVLARGEQRDDLGYLVRRRVRASNLAAAKRLLSGPPVSYSSTRGQETLRVAPGWERRFPPELVLHLPRRLHSLSLNVQDGTVTALDMDGAVAVNAKAGSIVVDRIQSSVTAQTGGGEIRLGRIRGAIRCLSGGGGISVDSAGDQAVLETAGGEIFIREASGPVFAATGGGNIEIQRAVSLVNARTNGGLVSVNQALGMVRANTSGGAIRIGVAKGVQCESAAGAIELQSVSGALRASTLMGSILANIQDGRFEDSFLNTNAGDITVFLPSNLAVTVQADNEMSGAIGRILSEFPEIRVYRGIWSGGRPIQAQGTLNGGGPVLKLAAAGGIISLKRQK
ncbi:MAG: hypothetical protein IT167_03835 [Bryobacterales bacterium]|nr:hypothetical protein [Bryobacterales bacterium]